MSTEPPHPLSGADQALVERYLTHVRVEKRLAARTVTLYELDLHKLAQFAVPAGVALTAVQNHHVRRWVAQMHAGGRSGRGIGLILSGWRGFYVWLGREGLISANPVQDVRAPKQARPLPKALGVDEAMHLADHSDDDDDPWLEARDAAMVELLYGAGLRVGNWWAWMWRPATPPRAPGAAGSTRRRAMCRCRARAANAARCRWAAPRPRRWRAGWRCAGRLGRPLPVMRRRRCSLGGAVRG